MEDYSFDRTSPTKPVLGSNTMTKISSAALFDTFPALCREIESKLHDSLKQVFRLNAGGNNQLYVVTLDKSPVSLLVKKYYPDNLQRLEREYGAVSYLASDDRIKSSVTQSLWLNLPDYYGVYVYQPGYHKTGGELTETDCTQIADFIISLQTVESSDDGVNFNSAVRAATCLNSYLSEISRRQRGFQSAIDKGEVAPRVIDRVVSLRAVERISDFVVDVTKRYPQAFLSEFFPEAEKRLNPMDFSLFSTIFRPDRPPCFVDFEYFGWDDPLHMMTDFLQHDRSTGISAVNYRFMLDYYCQSSNLSDSALSRLPLTLSLKNATWAAMHLAFLTGDKLKQRQFAVGSIFGLDVYLDEQLLKLEVRLDNLSVA